MKKVYLVLAILLLSISGIFAQFPHAINFQAIARDANGDVMISTPIQIRLTIIDGSATGTDVYQELRALTTNAYGSFSFQIGRDANYVTIGSIEGIDWNTGAKFLKIDYDPTNQFNWNLTLGTIEFVSVPFALSAESVSFIDATNAQDGDVLVYNSTTGMFEPQAVAGTNYTAGSGISISGNTISAVDNSATNEFQTLTLNGADLSLSNGNTVTLPTGTTYIEGAGISISGNTITNSGDLSSSNEIQVLNLSGNSLSLSNGGGSVTLPSGGSSQWTTSGSDISYNLGNVGIGTNNPDINDQLELYRSNTYSNELAIILENGLGDQEAILNFGDGLSSPDRYIGRIAYSHLYDRMSFSTSGDYQNPSLNINSIGNIGIGTKEPTSKLQVVGLPEYANNSAAISAGLTVGAFYHTAGVVKVVY